MTTGGGSGDPHLSTSFFFTHRGNERRNENNSNSRFQCQSFYFHISFWVAVASVLLPLQLSFPPVSTCLHNNHHSLSLLSSSLYFWKHFLSVHVPKCLQHSAFYLQSMWDEIHVCVFVCVCVLAGGPTLYPCNYVHPCVHICGLEFILVTCAAMRKAVQ